MFTNYDYFNGRALEQAMEVRSSGPSLALFLRSTEASATSWGLNPNWDSIASFLIMLVLLLLNGSKLEHLICAEIMRHARSPTTLLICAQYPQSPYPLAHIRFTKVINKSVSFNSDVPYLCNSSDKSYGSRW